MTKGDLIKLLDGIDDNVEVHISGKAVTKYYNGDEESNWWDIKRLDSDAKMANEFEQVVIILSDIPIME